MLHAAAEHGQAHVLERVLALDTCPSAWALDTQGRTALHVAAAHGRAACVGLLRRAMAAERCDPVGPNAPEDLGGRTPCAWAVGAGALGFFLGGRLLLVTTLVASDVERCRC